jgi:hypothetical protein
MDKNYCIDVANEISNQITAAIGVNGFFSWGVRSTAATEIGDNPALLLNVDGLLFSGYVSVELTAADDYTVRFYSRNGKEIEKVEGLYCDNIGYYLDGRIEKDPTLTDDEYIKRAMADSDRKISLQSCEL